MQTQQVQAQLRQLELQVATEVTNAVIQIRAISPAHRGRHPPPANSPRNKLAAEQSRFEAGLSTNFFVVQAQRDLSAAQDTELRAILDQQKALIELDRVQRTSLSQAGIQIVPVARTRAGPPEVLIDTHMHRGPSPMKKLSIVVVLATLGITAYGYLGFRTTEFIPEVSTVNLARGDVVDTVGATGALEAVTTVQVGSQVSGIIEALYADFNSIVRRRRRQSHAWNRPCSSRRSSRRAPISPAPKRTCSGCASPSKTPRRSCADRRSSRPAI